LRPRLAARELTLEVTPAARARLAERGYDPEFGARPLKRLIQHSIIEPLSTAILERSIVSGMKVVVDVADSEAPGDVARATSSSHELGEDDRLGLIVRGIAE
ncbi:MAG: hypothetical protein IAG13_23870, partial [Deltaproteobacteria bacterium]|nr:hypothetical protein [Nannocystaceae bacterium]